jgi:hypothetical protein
MIFMKRTYAKFKSMAVCIVFILCGISVYAQKPTIEWVTIPMHETLTKCSSNKGLSGNLIILPRSKFGVT